MIYTKRFNQQLNLFQIIDNNKHIYSNIVEVSSDILSQLMKLDINFEGLDTEGVKNVIKNKIASMQEEMLLFSKTTDIDHLKSAIQMK